MQAGGGISLKGLAVFSVALLAILGVLSSMQYPSVKAGALKLTGAGMVTSAPDSGAVRTYISAYVARPQTLHSARHHTILAHILWDLQRTRLPAAVRYHRKA